MSGCDETKPILKNLLVEIGPWNGTDPGDAGDFYMDSINNPEKYVYAFGEYLTPSKRIPNIEFRPKLDAIISPVDGVVHRYKRKYRRGKRL